MLSFDITTDSNTRTTFYQRTISPLKKIDYIAIASMTGGAALVSIVALCIFDFFITPLFAVLCTLSVIGSCHLIKYRSEVYFHRKSLEKLGALHTLASHDHAEDATEINKIVNQLKEDPCFKHLQDRFNPLADLAEKLIVNWETNIDNFRARLENLQDQLKM